MGSTTSNRSTIAVGVLSVIVGVVPLLEAMGILPINNGWSDPAPSWLGWPIGGLFIGAGVIVVMRGALNVSDQSSALPASAPRVLRLMHDTIALGIVGGLALVSSWVAFGPGPRHFSLGLDGLWLHAPGLGQVIGRAAFGFGALFVWCIVGALAVTTVRKWRR